MEGLVLLVPLVFLAGTWALGRHAEQKHYRSIHTRERASRGRPVLTSKRLPDDSPVHKTALAVGAVVVSADYFKTFVSGFRQLIGGEMHAYAPVLDRARREAILRMKESSPDADLFVNLRLQTAQIGSLRSEQIPIVEVIAYSTAVFLAPASAPAGPTSGLRDDQDA